MAGELFTKKLWLNVGLAFVAGFATSLGAFIAATPKPVDESVLVSAVAAAAWGAFRLAAGLVAAAAGTPVPVDE